LTGVTGWRQPDFLIAFAEGAHLLVRQRDVIPLLHRRPRETYGYVSGWRSGARPRYLKASGIAVGSPATDSQADTVRMMTDYQERQSEDNPARRRNIASTAGRYVL